MAEPLTCYVGDTRWQAHGRPGHALDASGDDFRPLRQVSQPLAQPVMDEWPLLSHLELGALPGAAACARLHARHVLWEWGLSAFAENAELLVSELVTNATRASPSVERIQPVGLWLSSDRSRVLILVQDTSSRLPEPADDAGDYDERGRGLLIVEAISAKWGWDAKNDSGGKVVWALIE
jgi:anti-sigma regulatory factor (Ser/Thr protein kinase)